MNYVSVAELKAKLSEHLKVVREGGSVTVTSHRTPVAELRPVSSENHLDLQMPTRPVSDVKHLSGVEIPSLDLDHILDEERGNR